MGGSSLCHAKPQAEKVEELQLVERCLGREERMPLGILCLPGSQPLLALGFEFVQPCHGQRLFAFVRTAQQYREVAGDHPGRERTDLQAALDRVAPDPQRYG